MSESFRLRKSILVQGIVCTLLFMVATIGSVSVMFLYEPEKQGVKGEHSAANFASLSPAVFFGGMTTLSVYTLLAYYVEHVAIMGTRILVRSVFQNRQFEASDVGTLVWKAIPVGGRLDLWVPNQRTKVDLHGFRDEDRLRIIRLFRGLIPEEKQVDWPLFCHKIALPLRDRRLNPPTGDSISRPADGEVIITRQRYDRLAIALLPMTFILAIAIWWITTSPTVFVIPACIALFWLFLRYSVRPEGQRQMRLAAKPGSRTMLFAMIAIIGSQLVVAALGLAGVRREAGFAIGLLIVVPAFAVFIYGVYRVDREQKRDAETAAKLAPERWKQGEPPGWQFSLSGPVHV